jgi:hypothetical protein
VGSVAVLSLHSHRDRSFLDDVGLHEASGELRAAGIDNDLVVACITAESDVERLVMALQPYSTIVYERVWSAKLIDRIADRVPNARFVRLVGEHDLVARADHVCRPQELVPTLARLLEHALPREAPRARPNLTPVYVAEEDRPSRPSYPIKGSAGCPYSTDARSNPLFDGIAIPERFGRGCSFCTTGNDYEHKKPADALEDTLDQLRYVRAAAPHIETLVLRDQNPFAYLTELVEAAETEKLGPFTLLVESRADWWLQNAKRFERALSSARRSSIRIAPFLVGVENFSQRELDRFNKGIRAEINVRFLRQLRAWANDFAPAVDLGQGAFGFILFTPWTTVDDLRENLRCIEETKLDELRGRLLLSRARLYPDTALYYLAERDGLLIKEYASRADDASARYGYLPAHPWRFADARVAEIADVAAKVLERRAHRDELAVFRAVLDDGDLTVEAVEARLSPFPRWKLELAEALVRAPRLPIDVPMFDLRLTDLAVDGAHVILTVERGDQRARIRVRGAGDVAVDRCDAGIVSELTRIAGRLTRAITPELWERARELFPSQ